jgi:hypothetical protein
MQSVIYEGKTVKRRVPEKILQECGDIGGVTARNFQDFSRTKTPILHPFGIIAGDPLKQILFFI